MHPSLITWGQTALVLHSVVRALQVLQEGKGVCEQGVTVGEDNILMEMSWLVV